jgi:23S rRNA (uridine2552-2'-O)-methyltransferase
VWRKNQKSDHFYSQAKTDGYRSRSAYKLLQIQEKFKIIRSHSNVFDLGCAPGGWLQVAKSITKGRVFGIDLSKIDPIEDVCFLRADFTDQELVETLLAENHAPKHFDVIMSDMAPPNNADRFAYQYAAIDLIEAAYNFALLHLAKDGYFVAKLFEGCGTQELLTQIKQKMEVKLFKPKASRSESTEIFLIAQKKLIEK